MKLAKLIVCTLFLIMPAGQMCLLLPAPMGLPANTGGQPGDFAGAWESTFNCTSTCGPNFQGDEFLIVTQNGANASFTDQAGFQASGTINGAVFTWSGAGNGYTESGTWTLLADGTVSKTTQYQGTCSGDCTGSLVRDADGIPDDQPD